VICGLSRGVKRAHLIRAALESITYQMPMWWWRCASRTTSPDGADGRRRADHNDWLMQYQADLLGCPVMRSDVPSCRRLARPCWRAKR
jgi:glycerol kinase